jgi:hypothetical protein
MTTSYMAYTLIFTHKGYILFMLTHRAHACERGCATGRVVKHSRIFGPTLFNFAVNILQSTTSSMGYVLVIITHRAQVRALGKTHSLIFRRILFKFAGHILQMTTSYMGYTLIFTHRGHMREINCSLIYGRFLFKCGVNIQHLTTSSKGYILFMFTHRAHACERARVRARTWFNSQLSLRDSLQI